MATELFANNYSTALSSGCGPTDISISVPSAAPTELQGGQFRIKVENEYMLVTGGQTGTTWSVTRGIEGTTPAAHASLSVVKHIVTAGSLMAFTSVPAGADQDLIIRSGTTWAALPKGTTGQQLLVRSDGTVKYTNAPEIFALAWGLKFDGVTDDTTAWSNLAAAIPSGGANVRLPWGNSILASNTVSGVPTGTRFVGAGAGTTTITMKANTATGAGPYYLFQQANNATDIVFEGIKFDGNKRNGNHGGTEAIDAIWCSHDVQRLTINRCWFYNWRGDALYIGSKIATQPSEITVTYNRFEDMGVPVLGDAGNARMGLGIICGDKIRVTHNYFTGIGAFGIDLEVNSSSDTFTNVLIAHNQGDNLATGLVNVAPTTTANAVDVNVSHNTVPDVCSQAFVVKANNSAISGNIAPKATLRALLVKGSYASIVGGVYGIDSSASVVANQTAPIFLSSADHCTVSGPVCIDSTTGQACQGAVFEDSFSNHNTLRGVATNNATRYFTQAGGGTGSTTDTKTIRKVYTFAVRGTIAVATGSTDLVNYIPPMFVSLGSSETVKLAKVRYVIGTGTSATFKLQKNGVDITGFTGLSATTTAASTAPTAVSVAEDDQLAIVVTAISGSPGNLSVSLDLESTVN